MARSPASTDSARVRQIYEQRPYPASDEARLKNPHALPTEWIKAVTGLTAPRRILVAGCGTGREAFGLSRAFPEAEIVAVDFSPRSIDLAVEAQRRGPSWRRIRFAVADLASRRLRSTTGGNFDLVTCHGVLTYIPKPERVLENLARCSTPNGTLYLGVNGTQHRSASLRAALPHFSFDIKELRDGPAVRNALRLCDAIQGTRGTDRCAPLPPMLLAGDIFGPVMQNDALTTWVQRARQAGWQFHASLSAQYRLRKLWQQPIGLRLMPRSRSQACLLADALEPSAFHRLVFTRQPAVNPPWDNHESLLDWRPAMTAFYSLRMARTKSAGLRRITLKGTPWNTRLDCQMPDWGVEIFCQSDGRRSVRQILASSPAPARMLREQLYLLYQLMVLNFSPPASR